MELREKLLNFGYYNVNLWGQYWNLFLAPGSCHGDSGGPVFQPALQSNGSSVVYVVLGQWF